MFKVSEVNISSAEVKHVNHLMCKYVTADWTHPRVVLADNDLHNSTSLTSVGVSVIDI